MTPDKATLRFIRLLSAKTASSKSLTGEVIVSSSNNSARLPKSVVTELVREGVVDWQAGQPIATAQTRSWLRRMLSGAAENASEPDQAAAAISVNQRYANQHRQNRSVLLSAGPVSHPHAHVVTRNDNESPLTRLALLKRPDKSPYILPHHIVAGDRLRTDFDKAHLSAAVTMNWNAAYSSTNGSGAGGSDISDMAIDARTRLSKCRQALGEEMAGVLIDFCGYLKGLETIEQERDWPRRSAKLAIRLALDQLARHYGFDCSFGETSKPRHQHGSTIRGWGQKPGRCDTGA